MSDNIHGTFVSEKINKIRWRPNNFNNAHYFVTGSVDNDPNNIKLWDVCETPEDDVSPVLISSYPYCGNVTEIKFLNSDCFVTSSTSGSIHLMKIVDDVSEGISLKNETAWKKIHSFKNGDNSPCTSLAVYENDIATVGEDGCINLLRANSHKVIRKIDEADSCSLYCVIFTKYNEILTGNLRGQMKIWDLRASNRDPKITFMRISPYVTPTCLTYHPTQRHLIVAGDDTGTITTWDLRHNTYPVNILNPHNGMISEIQFHPDYPDQLFSCSTAGQIWHWPAKNKNILSMDLEITETNVWLTPDIDENKLEVLSLMPPLSKSINTLDLDRDRVICGCDNEAIYLITNISLY